MRCWKRKGGTADDRRASARQSQSFYGDQAEQSLQNYHFDLLFLGVDAIDLDRGVSTHNEDEARLNRKMCEVAERIIVVTDSSKFNRSSCIKSLIHNGLI
jgi:DeoR family transcriptional regulator of aga operon